MGWFFLLTSVHNNSIHYCIRMTTNPESSLFPNANQFPDFFNQNLTDPNRILKVMIGPYCWVRAFYFQLFKLMFEIQSQEQKVKDIGYILISSAKQALKNVKDPNKMDKLKECINTIEIFIGNLSNNSELDFETFINENKYIDKALIDVFVEIMKDAGQQNSLVYEKLKFLGELFSENMNQFEMGIKYEESDTFLYIQNEEEIYIAYLNINQLSQEEHKEQNTQSNNDSIQPIMYGGAVEEEKGSPVDYLFSNKYRSNDNGENEVRKQIFSEQVKKEEDIKNGMDFTLGTKKQQLPNSGAKQTLVTDQNNIRKMQTTQSSGRDSTHKQQSIVEYYNEHEISNKGTKMVSPQIVKELNNEQIFYKPPIKSAIQSANIYSPNELKQKRKDPLDLANDSEKGTFYRKFTDTRILNLITQPHRTKIKMLKNRFIGIHSRKNTGIIYETHTK